MTACRVAKRSHNYVRRKKKNHRYDGHWIIALERSSRAVHLDDIVIQAFFSRAAGPGFKCLLSHVSGLKEWHACIYPVGHLASWGPVLGLVSRCQYTVTGWGSNFWSAACLFAAVHRHHLGPASWRSTTVKWRQFSQSNRQSTSCTRQTEYHEALPSSANDEVRCDCTFADDGNASWYSVCRVPMVEWCWTVKTVVTWWSSDFMIPAPGLSPRRSLLGRWAVNTFLTK